MIAFAIDRLDRRRNHTFGNFLEHLVAGLRDEAPDLEIAVVRDRARREPLVPGVRELRVPRALESTEAYARLAPAWLRSRGARLVHFPFLFTPATWAGGPAARLVTVHGASRAALDDDLVSRFSDRELERTKRRLRAYPRVITVSESAREEVVEYYGVPRDRVTVVYNGTSECYRPEARDAAVLAKLGVRAPYLLTVSTIKPKKNVVASVRAFARLLELHPDTPHSLVLVGFKAAGYTEVDDAVRELGLDGRVLQTGWTDKDDLPALFAGADLLVFPSLHEGFGLPVVEAMASGCPVVASDVYSIPEVAGGAAILFDPHDVEAIARAAERALFDAPERERLVAAGFARAAVFRWSECARRTAAVYRELLGMV